MAQLIPLNPSLRRAGAWAVALVAAALVAGCDDEGRRGGSARHWVPLSSDLMALMQEKAMHKHDPILIRSYKKESELEVWKRGRDGKYALLKTYPMCRWSGQLGPKIREGDRMAPEGFYAISAAQMNPNSSFHLSFDMGYPNAYDRAHGRSGSFLMVHGACTSRGCYSMTDAQIEEIYALTREAHSGGQKAVQMQAMPFRMTPQNLAKHRYDPQMAFWRNLKDGADHFETTRMEPKVAVCGRRYAFNTADGDACGKPADDVALLVAQKQRDDAAKVAELVQKGMPPVRIVYDDGGQHPSFRSTAYAYAGAEGESARPAQATRSVSLVAEMSRPEALETGPTVHLLDASGRTKTTSRAASADAAAIIAAAEGAAKPKPVETAKPSDARPSDTRIAQAAVIPASRTTASPASAATATTTTGGVTEVARAEAPSDRSIYQRMLSFTPFASAPLAGTAPASSNSAAAETATPVDAPLPPVRPANLTRASQPAPRISMVPSIPSDAFAGRPVAN